MSDATSDTPAWTGKLSYKYVIIGGGVSAGYWCHSMVENLDAIGVAPENRSIAMITTYPKGILPYERPALTKAAMNPANADMRKWACAAFPFTRKGTGNPALPGTWYDQNNIKIFHTSDATAVDFDNKIVTVCQPLLGGNTFQVQYEKLVIATGTRARTIDGSGNGLWSFKHADFHMTNDGYLGLCAPYGYGFGSVHYPRDIGDAEKLVFAISRKEEVGMAPIEDPVVICGGGYITMEVAAGIKSFCPHLDVLVIMRGEQLLDRFFPPEISDFYVDQLAKRGVKFARGYNVVGLWPKEESGDFPTLGGDDPLNLEAIEPQTFRDIDENYTTCRGVIVKHKVTGQVLRVQARFVVCGLGIEPNSAIFKDKIDMDSSGFILVDSQARTSHRSGDVHAIGDIARYPLPLMEGRMARSNDHVQSARDMAAHVAKYLVGLPTAPFDPVPFFYSRFFDLAWKFYGLDRGETVVVGRDSFAQTKTFGGYWVEDGRVVGIFLEGGTADMHSALPKIARMKPRVSSIDKLRSVSMQEFLLNPQMFQPPELGPGEFLAEKDEAAILDVLKKYSKDVQASDTIDTAHLPDAMKELGANWTEPEVQEVIKVLDCDRKGNVRHTTFVKWWKS